jgi:hypothetical protein
MTDVRGFSQYDAVRIRRLPAHHQAANDAFNVRPPRVGDIAYIVDIYTDPPGYELECSDQDGITQWLIAFSPDEVELERIGCKSVAGCHFRYFFDPGSGTCLWSANYRATAQFGYAVALDELGLPEEVTDRASVLIARFDASINWADPAGASPWAAVDLVRFAHDAATLLDDLRASMPSDVSIVDETDQHDGDAAHTGRDA